MPRPPRRTSPLDPRKLEQVSLIKGERRYVIEAAEMCCESTVRIAAQRYRYLVLTVICYNKDRTEAQVSVESWFAKVMRESIHGVTLRFDGPVTLTPIPRPGN